MKIELISLLKILNLFMLGLMVTLMINKIKTLKKLQIDNSP